MRNHKVITYAIALWSLLIVSCQDSTLFHSYQPVALTGWERTDTLFYTLDKSISNLHTFKYEIGIRHKDSYQYRDIWLQINRDTVHFYLADPKGKWLGHGLGELRQITFAYSPSFDSDTIKTFQINHIMQDNPLMGIHDIGIQIKEISD